MLTVAILANNDQFSPGFRSYSTQATAAKRVSDAITFEPGAVQLSDPRELFVGEYAMHERHFYTLSAETLAKWIEEQPDQWWTVDGDPKLTSVVDFPCPSDELAPKIKKIGKFVKVFDTKTDSQAHGEPLADLRLMEDLSDRKNRNRRRVWLMSWSDSVVDWLLMEDDALVAKS